MTSRSHKFAALAVVALALVPPVAAAAGKKKETAPAAPAVPAEAPMTKNPINLVPDGMKWGMPRAEMEKLVDRFIDDDFRAKFKEAGSSGSKIKDLETEVANQKQAFRRSWIDLGNGPTGLDSGPLVAEYSKGNGEAIMSHHRGPGVKIWFFFIGGRLWKTLEEVSFVKGGLYGETMPDAAAKLMKSVGSTLPRATPANPEKGQYHDVLDWNDQVTHMRIWDRSGVLVLVREERSTVANLPNLRKASSAAKGAPMDPQIAAILRGEGGPAPSASASAAKKR